MWPERIGEHLHLDVARSLDEPLEQQGVVAERGCSDAARRAERVGELRPRSRTTTMPLPPPPADGLTSSGKPTPFAAAMSSASDAADTVLSGDPRHRRHAALARRALRADLVAHRLDRLDARSDEDDAGGGARGRELRVLGEESVAGVDGVGARLASRPRAPRRCSGSSRSRAPGRGARRHRRWRTWCASASASLYTATERMPMRLQRADDAARDLAAIGDEHGAERRCRCCMTRSSPSHPEQPEGRLGQRHGRADVEREAEDACGCRRGR